MMRLLLLWGWIIIPGYGAMVGPKEVSGPEGSSLSVQCFYEDKHEENSKYWCKVTGLFFQRCITIITTESGKEETDGKMSIMDNPQSRTFTVIMRNLTLKDAGQYQCGISRFGVDEVFEVTVVVFSASSSYHPKVNVPTQEKIKPTTFINVGTRAAKPQWRQDTFQTRTQQDMAQAVTPHHHPNDIKSKSRPSIPLIRILAPCIILLLLLVVVIATLLVLSARRKKACTGNRKEWAVSLLKLGKQITRLMLDLRTFSHGRVPRCGPHMSPKNQKPGFLSMVSLIPLFRIRSASAILDIMSVSGNGAGFGVYRDLD
ncbi:CMRF35-like molecule 9 isoform X2 [Monodelphis domestica]|uniref:CMRF35-like molecule 9 isoform X2 n=1 Tax=Monodelphis domestica TaxID=13616 RepID=UPI000443262B|nr:CMRF35-like molecule 9 isoform X2 [Monodelphis domestica]